MIEGKGYKRLVVKGTVSPEARAERQAKMAAAAAKTGAALEEMMAADAAEARLPRRWRRWRTWWLNIWPRGCPRQSAVEPSWSLVRKR